MAFRLVLIWQHQVEENSMPLGTEKAVLMGSGAAAAVSASGGTETTYTGYKVHSFF